MTPNNKQPQAETWYSDCHKKPVIVEVDGEGVRNYVCPECQKACDVVSTPQPSEGKNKELGLPFGKMRKIRIAFDVDGTLRCNCTETCRDPNQRIVDLFNILRTFKNTELYVWSGGGADYAERFADLFGLDMPPSRCISKIGAPQMDIAIDDIQDTAIGTINLIVKEK